MRLNELTKYNDIVIQCHDNPDADALSSGYALYWYLTKQGKTPRFIYRGHNRISKNNLIIMLEKLAVPISYEPDFDETPELLITVDCQYGQKNVTCSKAQNIAIIDHHQSTVELPALSEVRSNIGSCATVMWDMLREEGISVDDDILLSTALYYGLYTDTNKLSEVSHPLDRDMRDSLVINKSLVTEMSNSNISLNELKITGKAIFDYEYNVDNKCIVIKADQCDPTILGVISDFTLETVGVDVCLAYYVSPQEIKFSVRSCVKEVHANELAAFLATGIGGGGGHLTKAGGAIRPEKLANLYEDDSDMESIVRAELGKRLDQYFSMYRIIYAKETTLDTTDMKIYKKIPQQLGCARLTDLFPLNTMVEIRTLEGDINVRIEEDKYLMIGIAGEVYPIAKEKLESSYNYVDEPYDKTFEYKPCIKDVLTGEKKNVLSYAKSVVSTGDVRIYAKTLDDYVKLFTAWDEEKYYSGCPGDYIAVREDDPHDIYIINGQLFDKLYKEADA
ncbi:MAG: recombinase RecJ [Lachnospiraceae bacterium]|jgi:phosphoglycolate phosphatase|nr:recombinase RecJ [Lachnospiraceae bacterium]